MIAMQGFARWANSKSLGSRIGGQQAAVPDSIGMAFFSFETPELETRGPR
jgi:hypothetical protein